MKLYTTRIRWFYNNSLIKDDEIKSNPIDIICVWILFSSSRNAIEIYKIVVAQIRLFVSVLLHCTHVAPMLFVATQMENCSRMQIQSYLIFYIISINVNVFNIKFWILHFAVDVLKCRRYDVSIFQCAEILREEMQTLPHLETSKCRHVDKSTSISCLKYC